MARIDDALKAEYFKRVFESIDGLWFMKLEEEEGFDRALEIDTRVWGVVPKIQARALRSLLGMEGGGLEALREALETKFELEDYSAELELGGAALTVKVKKCPWHNLMLKSGREHLAGRVGEAICGAEYPVWMKEFGVEGSFEMGTLLCAGADCCAMRFRMAAE